MPVCLRGRRPRGATSAPQRPRETGAQGWGLLPRRACRGAGPAHLPPSQQSHLPRPQRAPPPADGTRRGSAFNFCWKQWSRRAAVAAMAAKELGLPSFAPLRPSAPQQVTGPVEKVQGRGKARCWQLSPHACAPLFGGHQEVQRGGCSREWTGPGPRQAPLQRGLCHTAHRL